MKKYLLRMQGFSSCISWEHSFETTSDKLARNYASAALTVDRAAKAGALRVVLFDITEDKYITSFVFKEPVVAEQEFA